MNQDTAAMVIHRGVGDRHTQPGSLVVVLDPADQFKLPEQGIAAIFGNGFTRIEDLDQPPGELLVLPAAERGLALQ